MSPPTLSEAPAGASAPRLEDYLGRDEVAALLRVSPYTVKRYWLTGHRGVLLRSALIGKRRVTTRGWIDQFVADVTATDCRAEEYAVELPRPDGDASQPYDVGSAESIAAAREFLRAGGVLRDADEQTDLT